MYLFSEWKNKVLNETIRKFEDVNGYIQGVHMVCENVATVYKGLDTVVISYDALNADMVLHSRCYGKHIKFRKIWETRSISLS